MIAKVWWCYSIPSKIWRKLIKSTYLIDEADFVSCLTAYVNQYDLLKGLKNGGTFLLNTL